MSQTYQDLVKVGRYYRKQFGKKRLTNREYSLMLIARLHNLDRIHCYVCGNPDLPDLLGHHKRYETAFYSEFGYDATANDVYHLHLIAELMHGKLTEDDIVVVCKECHKEIHGHAWEILECVKQQDEQTTRRKSNKLSQLLYMIPYWWGNEYSLFNLENNHKLLNIVGETIIGDKKNNLKSWRFDNDYIMFSKLDFLENDYVDWDSFFKEYLGSK